MGDNLDDQVLNIPVKELENLDESYKQKQKQISKCFSIIGIFIFLEILIPLTTLTLFYTDKDLYSEDAEIVVLLLFCFLQILFCCQMYSKKKRLYLLFNLLIISLGNSFILIVFKDQKTVFLCIQHIITFNISLIVLLRYGRSNDIEKFVD